MRGCHRGRLRSRRRSGVVTAIVPLGPALVYPARDDTMTRFARACLCTCVYQDRYEFQLGQVLVWVITPPFAIPDTGLERAERMFDEVWGAIPTVVSAAEKVSRAQLPEFWMAHDDAGTAGDRLAVWGMWIDPINGSVDYEVGENFEPMHHVTAHLPEMPDDSRIAFRSRLGWEPTDTQIAVRLERCFNARFSGKCRTRTTPGNPLREIEQRQLEGMATDLARHPNGCLNKEKLGIKLL